MIQYAVRELLMLNVAKNVDQRADYANARPSRREGSWLLGATVLCDLVVAVMVALPCYTCTLYVYSVWVVYLRFMYACKQLCHVRE